MRSGGVRSQHERSYLRHALAGCRAGSRFGQLSVGVLALALAAFVLAPSGSGASTTPAAPATVAVTKAVIMLPRPLTGYPYARVEGETTFELEASSTVGVKSVQFTIDGAPVGTLFTTPNAGRYRYELSFDTSTLSPGIHSVSATVSDNFGNVSDAPPLSIRSGPIVYLPVLNYHGIEGPLDTKPTIYDETHAEALAQLSYLKDHGYRTVTIGQYDTWLTTGSLPRGISKPVLITVDDGLTDEQAWDPLLREFGFTAVLYVVTGFADNKTPGADHPAGNLSWPQIRALAADGRWQVGFHAGEYGHGDYKVTKNTVSLSGGRVLRFSPTCFYFYTCLGKVSGPVGTPAAVRTVPETTAQFEARVRAEVEAGIDELKAEVPSANMLAWVCPWNACGQWVTDYNDPSGAAERWLPGFFASLFPIVFTETNPIRYGASRGRVGALNGDDRRFRFEVLTRTTQTQFVAALTAPAFANN